MIFWIGDLFIEWLKIHLSRNVPVGSIALGDYLRNMSCRNEKGSKLLTACESVMCALLSTFTANT